MSALEHVSFPAHINTTASLPVSWGEGWIPPEAPFPPAPRRRRKRRGGGSMKEGGERTEEGEWEGGGREANAHLNDSALEQLFLNAHLNLTAEDMDYMFNMSIGGGGMPWGGRGGGSAVGYALNAAHRRNNTSIVKRQRKKGGSQSNESCYCGNSESLLRRMALAYRPLHPVAALTVCALGTLANALNVAVLTRPHLAPAPVNRILTAIAAADATLMAEYAVFAIIVWIPHSKVRGEGAPQMPTMTPAEEAARAERDFPFAAAAFVLFHMHFSQVLHTVSICLTLTLAVWRLLALRLPPERARTLCSRRRCSIALAISVLLPVLLCSPSYLVFGITTTHITMGAPHPKPAIHEDFSVVSSIDYPLDPGFLLPTVAMVLEEKEEGYSTIVPSPEPTSEGLRYEAWGPTPHRGEEEREQSSPMSPLPTLWVPPISPFPYPERPTGGATHPPPAVAVLYHLDLSAVAKEQDEMLYIVNFWVYAVILKLLPCLVLTVISFCLVRTLCRAKSRRRTLENQGEVKKAQPTKTLLNFRWRKAEAEKVVISVENRAAPPPTEVRKEKPLDDGGVWMGKEVSEKNEGETEEEDVKGNGNMTTTTAADPPPTEEEEEAVTLVQAETPTHTEEAEEDEAGSKGWWLCRAIKRRGRTENTAQEGRDGGCGAQQQPNVVAIAGAAMRRRRRRTERTTRMLVAVLVLFLVTEFPQGVLGLMSGLFGRCFFRTCYNLFGDLMDLLALINGSINFILYCAMSRQFRQTFAQLFCKHPRKLWTYFCKGFPSRQTKDMEIMKNGNMGGEGLRKVGAAGGQTSQSMGEVQSTYV